MLSKPSTGVALLPSYFSDVSILSFVNRTRCNVSLLAVGFSAGLITCVATRQFRIESVSLFLGLFLAVLCVSGLFGVDDPSSFRVCTRDCCKSLRDVILF